MEGLIPMVLKAIKKNRTQRHYESLSPSYPSSSLLGVAAAAPTYPSYQHQSFFTNNNNIMASAASSAGAHQRHRRRHTATESDLHRRPPPPPHHHDLDHDHDIHHHQHHTDSYYNYGIGGNHNDPQVSVMYQQQHPMTRKQLVRFNSHKLFSCVTGAAY